MIRPSSIGFALSFLRPIAWGLAVSRNESDDRHGSPGFFEPRPWGRADAVAILVWTLAIVAFSGTPSACAGPSFTSTSPRSTIPIAPSSPRSSRPGRFSRWCPGLYCGLPLFSESQAGYLHPFKYLLYPWMETWKAFNLDTVLSIWLTGLGSYLWLRRHVGPTRRLPVQRSSGSRLHVGAPGAHEHDQCARERAVRDLGAGVLVVERALARRGVGAAAMAFQTFAGHLQDVFLTAGLVGLYGLYRAATERGIAQRLRALGMAVVLVGLGVLLSAVQWVPSKELLDRSPRAAGLSWADLTFGSWHPELLPTMVVREAYGTRARDTDWMDGYYPYHEMNTYLGLIAIVLAIAGAGGKPARPLGDVLGFARGARPGAHAREVHLPVRLCASDSDSGELARAGAIPPLAGDGGGGACGRRGRAAGAQARGVAPARFDRGGLAHRALDPDPLLSSTRRCGSS